MIRSLTTTYAGRKFRSRTEGRWAIFLDACGIPYEYEHEGYALPCGPYLPDFWLPSLSVFLEIKGQDPTDDERAKCVALAAASGRPVMLAVGSPKPEFQILWFVGDEEWPGESDERFVIARDRHAGAGYWLVSEDGGRWLGGGKVLGPVFGPMLSGPIDEAYEAALSARFERGEWPTRHPIIEDRNEDRNAA